MAAQPELKRIFVAEEHSAEHDILDKQSTAADVKTITGPTKGLSNELRLSSSSGTNSLPPAYLVQVLEDAELLLKYATEFGIEIAAETRSHVLRARIYAEAGWDENTSADLLAGFGKLSAQTKPVTAESLRACKTAVDGRLRSYWRWAGLLAIVIMPFSVASFVSSALCRAIRSDITLANDLAVRLRTRLGSPQDRKKVDNGDATTITELQQYATAIRSIDAHARQLNLLFFNMERDPFSTFRKDAKLIHEKLQLPPGLTDFAKIADDRTIVYQDVRYFGQSLVDDVAVFYGAITACILPVLYALLGTCAYLLRGFEQQIKSRTFVRSEGYLAHFLIAAIGGAVVGLFNNFTIGQGASIPPLAIAFLVGYAVDVFFTFLETLVQTFTKTGVGPIGAVSASRNS